MTRAAEAADWYTRMTGPDADSHRPKFDQWMRDPANAAAYRQAADDFAFARQMSPARIEAKAQTERTAPGSLRWAVATVAALGLALGFAWYLNARRDVPQIAAGPMLPGQLRLADGSKVVLMDGAWVSPQFSDQERRIVLNGGRARFEVAHDAERPFIVVAGRSETLALGTIFEIDLLTPDMPRIALVKGSVEVRASGVKHPLRLSPGETAEVPTAGPRIMTGPAELMLPTALKTMGAPLGQVLDMANRANEVPIRLGDPALAGLEISGRFDVRDSQALARKLAAALDLEVEVTPDAIVLKQRAKKQGG